MDDTEVWHTRWQAISDSPNWLGLGYLRTKYFNLMFMIELAFDPNGSVFVHWRDVGVQEWASTFNYRKGDRQLVRAIPSKAMVSAQHLSYAHCVASHPKTVVCSKQQCHHRDAWWIPFRHACHRSQIR